MPSAQQRPQQPGDTGLSGSATRDVRLVVDHFSTLTHIHTVSVGWEYGGPTTPQEVGNWRLNSNLG